MKVLKQNTEHKGWKCKLVCTGSGNRGHGCKSLLLVGVTDVYETKNTDYGGGTDYYQTFCCPVCGTETDIPWTVRVPRMLGKQPSYQEREKLLVGHVSSE